MGSLRNKIYQIYHIIKSFIYPTKCTTRLFHWNVKTYIKIYIKVLLHVSVIQPSSGSLLFVPC